MMIVSITPHLDKQLPAPLYVQLYAYIRESIESGKLPSGGKLPAIRALAQHLNIGKNTIEAAYGQLLAEGYVESKERGGYIIQPIETWWSAPSEGMRSNQDERGSGQQMLEETAARPAERVLPFEFRYGDIAFDRFPHEVWKSCLTQAITDAAANGSYGILGYGDRLGQLELREELVQYVYQSRGVVCSPDQLFIAAGTQYALSLLVQILHLRRTVFAMEEPGYHGVRTVLAGMDCGIVPIPVAEDGIDLSALERSEATVAYVTPSHQFPLGMVMPVEKRLKLLKWAAVRQGFVLEDDYDSEFRYGSRPVPSLKALDTEDRVIYMGTLSKAFLPGARLSYVIMPRRFAQMIREKLASYSCSVSPIIQHAVWLFMKQGHYGRHIRRMRRVYQSRHRALTEAVAESMGSRVEVVSDRSGMHILLRAPGREAAELARLGESVGCLVYEAVKHWSEPDQLAREYVMLGFGGMDEERLRAGVRRLSDAWFPA